MVDKTFHFGTTGDTPVIGDWNSDRTSDVGVFRPINGNWYLDYNKTGVVDKTFHFGTTGDTPVVGDWNGAGTSEVGVFRPINGNWYLDYNKTGVVDKTFHFGTTGDSPNIIQPPKIVAIAPTAVFTSNKQFGTAPLTVSFTDQSTGTAPLTYAWDFTNDGTTDSTTRNSSFTYTSAGIYAVKLTVTNAVGNNTVIKTGYINVTTSPVFPTAAFTSNKQSGTAPLTVTFTDQSTGTAPLTYAWDFTNDGTTDSTARNSSFTYTSAGIYAVKLTVTNAVGNNTVIKTGYINVTTSPVFPTAAFTSNKQSGTAPLTVTFTDQSTGTAPLTYAWDFNNDGVQDSTTQNPSFTYTLAGTYTVKLTVTNAVGNNTVIKTGYIAVATEPVSPTAAFTSNKQSGTSPLTVSFTDQSTGTAPLTYAWDFTNDGTTDSTVRNPSFTYTSAGIYTVKLTVTNAAGSDVQRETDYITVTSIPESPKAAFTSNKQTGTAPLTVRFTDQSTGTAPLTYAWDFTNDGTTDSTARNPSFTYTSAGTYTVNLTVTNAVGSDVQRETDYITITDTPAGSHSGIALTFDDNSIDQWYAIRDLLKQYNAHATFFVTQYANLDESQINELKALQADGNEIGYHGYAHLDATEYLTNHTIAEYMNNEIINGVTLMRADGFDPVDFALPGGAGDENSGLIAALQQNFTHIRGIDRAPPFYQYGSNVALVHAQGIDDTSYGQSINDLYDLISTAKEDDEIVIFYAHIPVETVTGEYQVSYDRLNDILKNGSDQNMTFYTISEIH